MTTTVLSNASAGAPTLSASAGALEAVLDFCLVTYLGWTKTSAGSAAAYRQPAGTNQFYLRVDDSATTYARVRLFESITDLAAGTGTNPTPSDAQFSGGLYWGKAPTAGTTARPWMFVSDGKLFHLVIGLNSTAPAWGGVNTCYTFGDVASLRPGDAYGTLIVGDLASNMADAAAYCAVATPTNSTCNATQSGHYMARGYAQTGTSLNCSRIADAAAANGYGSNFGVGGIAYPAPIPGGIEIAKVFVGEASGRRGRLSGLWHWQHSSKITDADTFSGVAGTELAGRSFVFFRVAYPAAGAIVLETTDWS